MKSIRLSRTAFALVMGAACPSIAQTLFSHVSETVVAKVQSRFVHAFQDGGISAVSSDIKSCYEKTTEEKTPTNQNAVAACLLYDDTAVQFNEGVMNAFAAQGITAPPIDYLTEDAFKARVSIYGGIPFGDQIQFMGTFFGDAPNRIMRAVEQSIKNRASH